jgi:hypothetical protein
MRFSAIFRSVAWLIIMALLVQPWLGQRAVAMASGALNVLVICTGTGFKVIGAPADIFRSNHPAEAPDHHDMAGMDCPACLTQALGALENAGSFNPQSLHHYWIRETRISDRWVAGPLCHRPLGSRGPPSI